MSEDHPVKSDDRKLTVLQGGRGKGPEVSSSGLVDLSDEALVAEFRSGRDAAFDILYVRYRDRVLRYMTGMLRDRALAEEVYNATMFRVYSRLPDTVEPGYFRRYLFRAAYNASLNAGRRERNLRRTPPEGQSWGGNRLEAYSQATPEDRLAEGQILTLTWELLEKLPEDRRAALLLFHNDGLSYQEIADVLGRPIGTVRWLIHEARAALAARISVASGSRLG